MLPYNSQYASIGRSYGGSFSQPNPAPSSDFDDFYASQPSSSQAPQQNATRPRRECYVCGTRKMRKRSGLWICKLGHVQQDIRDEQADDDDGFAGDGVARKRRVQTVHKVRRLKSQHTPYFSEPDTDFEHQDSEEEQLEQQRQRAHKRARHYQVSSRTILQPEQSDQDDDDDGEDDDAPYSIRADSFFERPTWPRRSYAPSSAAEESGVESEPYSDGRSSRRGIRSVWRTGVGLQGAYEGRFALLQCLQLILRLQLQKLREVWGVRMPRETEAVARDLWSMLVSLLPVGHYPPEPLIAATFDWHTRNALSQEKAAELFPNHATYDPEADIRHHRRRMLFNSFHQHCERKKRSGVAAARMEADNDDSDDPIAAKELIDWMVGGDEEHRRARPGQVSDTEDDTVDPEDELAQLDPVFAEERRQQKRRSQLASSDSETGIEGDGLNLNDTTGRHKSRARRHIPVWATKHGIAKAQAEVLQLAILPTTLSVIYLSLHLLKIPVFWHDILRLVSSYSLPYLNVVHQLPLPLTRFLNKDNVHHHLLDTDAIPTITELHLHTLGVAETLQRTYGVNFGEGAVSGQLARIVEEMLLPPTFYVAIKRVLDLVARGVGPELMPTLSHQAGRRSRGRKQTREDDFSTRLPGAVQLQRVPKEFVMMAALLVVVKMRYGLDGRDRAESAASGKEGISCAPQVDAWLAALDTRKKRRQATADAVKDTDPAEIEALDMATEQVEAYASFVEEHLMLSNQIDLHEWRRLEPQRRWAAFADFMPAPDSDASTRQPAPDVTQTNRGFSDLERDLSSIYGKHSVRPCGTSSETSALPAGSSYTMHEFLGHPNNRLSSDPTALCSSPLYPRVIHHANDVVGISTPKTPSVALDIMIDIATSTTAKDAGTNVKAWEAGYGIQAHLEVVERLLEKEMTARSQKMRRVFAQMGRTKNGGSEAESGSETDVEQVETDQGESGNEDESDDG